MHERKTGASHAESADTNWTYYFLITWNRVCHDLGGRFGGQFLAASKACCSATAAASCSSCGVFAAASLRMTQTSPADAQCHIALE
ncbi:MAG: hypothetical protein ACREDJ_09740, partial [Methylocella sp.]